MRLTAPRLPGAFLFACLACATGSAQEPTPSPTPAATPQVQIKADVFGDALWGQEANLTVTVRDTFVLFQQNRREVTDGSRFSNVTAGGKLKLVKPDAQQEPGKRQSLTLTATAGPQFAEGRGLNRIAVFANFAYRRGGFGLDSLNKVTFGVKPGNPPSDRHVVRAHGLPLVPKDVAVRAEWLRNARGLAEAFAGGEKTLAEGEGGRLSVFVYRNFTRRAFDVRLAYSFSFGIP